MLAEVNYPESSRRDESRGECSVQIFGILDFSKTDAGCSM
jgi:hypothetical protein